MADDTFSPGDFDNVLRRVDDALAAGEDKDEVEAWALGWIADRYGTNFGTLGAVRRANLAEGGEGGKLRGMAQGATFGLADELTGAWKFISALAPGGRPIGEAGQAYREGQQRSQAGVERFRREHPVQAALSEVAGGLLVPGLGTVGLARAGAPVFRGLSSASRVARAGSGGLLGTAGATTHLAGEAEPGFRSRVSAGVPTWAGGEAPGWIHPLSAAAGGAFSAASPISRAMGGPTATQARVRGPLPYKLQSPIVRTPPPVQGPRPQPGKVAELLEPVRQTGQAVADKIPVRLRSPLAKVPEGEFFGRPQGQATGEILAEQTGRGVVPPPITASRPTTGRVATTEDGYKFFETPDGKWVDNLDPSGRDMTFNSLAELEAAPIGVTIERAGAAVRPPTPRPLPMRGAQGGTTDVAGEVGAVVNRAKTQREGLEAALEVDKQAVYGPLDALYATPITRTATGRIRPQGWATDAAVGAGHATEEVIDAARADARKLAGFLKAKGLDRVFSGRTVHSQADKEALAQAGALLRTKTDNGLNPSIKGMQALRRSLINITRGQTAPEAAHKALDDVEDIIRRMFPELEAADEIFKRSRQQLDGFNLGAKKSSRTLSFRNPDVELGLGTSVDELRHSIDEVMEIVKNTGGDLAQQQAVASQFLDGVFHRTILAPLQTRQRTQVIRKLQEMMGPGGDRTWLRTFFERAPNPKAAFEEFERQFARDIPAAVKLMEGLAGGLGRGVREFGLAAGGLLGKGITKTPEVTTPNSPGLLGR